MSGPLDRVGAIKLKLGATLTGGIVVTAGVLLGGTALGLPWWLNLAASLGLALLAVELLGSGLTAPLRQMARQADRLAAGHPVEPVDATSRDEVGDLARAFNRMAVEVAHTDRVRRELVANVSHELRTPLAALAAVLDNLVDGVMAADGAALDSMQSQVDRLSSLVHQLLDLSQLDAGAVVLDRHPADVAGVVAAAVVDCGEDAVRRVVVNVAHGQTVWVDPDRFRQVLVNLLANALRHGPDATPVTVTGSTDDGRLLLTVADEGDGIKPEDAERVFDRFARADDGRASADGGAGLGLAITRWIVELHGGTVAVDRPELPGARLTVELPMDAPAPDPTSADDALAPATEARVPAMAGGLQPPVNGTGATAQTARAAAASAATNDSDPLRMLPTPVAGLRPRSLIAVVVAALSIALLPMEGLPGVGLTLSLLVAAAAIVAALEERLDAFGATCCAIAGLVVLQISLSDAGWVIVPSVLGAVLLAGLGIWGPDRFGAAFRALVVGPLLTLVAPVAIARGARSTRGAAISRWLVPASLAVLVLTVFGGLLSGADAVFARMLDVLLPDVRLDETLLLRAILGGFALVIATTFVLVQRAGAMPSDPWPRVTRPRTDWAVPLGTLVGLMATFVVIQVGVLFGGADRVLQTAGLTYAEYAREGFAQLLVTAVLALVVIGAVVRVASDDDRRLRDRLLGALIGLTLVVLVSAVQRLAIYSETFGLTRLRVSAFAMLGWVAVVLLLVAVAGMSSDVRRRLPRTLIVFTGAAALCFGLARPDAIIARVNVDRYEATGKIDLDYLSWLSADAVPVLATRLPAEIAVQAIDGPYTDAPVGCPGTWRQRSDDGIASFNLARWQADRALVAVELSC